MPDVAKKSEQPRPPQPQSKTIKPNTARVWYTKNRPFANSFQCSKKEQWPKFCQTWAWYCSGFFKSSKRAPFTLLQWKCRVSLAGLLFCLCRGPSKSKARAASLCFRICIICTCLNAHNWHCGSGVAWKRGPPPHFKELGFDWLRCECCYQNHTLNLHLLKSPEKHTGSQNHSWLGNPHLNVVQSVIVRTSY